MMLLGIGIYFLLPLRVYAAEYPTATDLIDIINEHGQDDTFIFLWYPEEYEIEDDVTFFAFLTHFQYQGYYEFNRWGDLQLFEPRLRDVILYWLYQNYNYGYDTGFDNAVQGQLGISNFGGELYWNSDQQYFQINLFDSDELAYYKQRVAELESLIDDLNNQLDLEYDRGYDDGYADGYDAASGSGYWDGYLEGYEVGVVDGRNQGYDIGYYEGYHEAIDIGRSQGYDIGFSDGEKSKLVEKNEAFYQGIENWLVPAIITVIALGGFVTIAARKRREE